MTRSRFMSALRGPGLSFSRTVFATPFFRFAELNLGLRSASPIFHKRPTRLEGFKIMKIPDFSLASSRGFRT